LPVQTSHFIFLHHHESILKANVAIGDQ